VIAPLAYGVRRWFDGDRAEVLIPWLLRCQLPLTIIAALIYGFERVIPTRLPVIGGMMMAIIVFGLYGVALRREGVLAD
jgi:hypothetical protein